MNRKIAYILLGFLCFTATTTFSQTKKETLQEKVLRLATENQVLRQENIKLQQEIARLQGQIAQLEQKKAAPKPYYKTLEIEKTCEKYPRCKKWATESYRKDDLFIVNSIELRNEKVLTFLGMGHSGKVKTVMSAYCRESYPGLCFWQSVVAYDGVAVE